MTIATDATIETFNIRTHNGTLTIVSRETGSHRTVDIRTATYKDGSLHRIVSLLSGPDNESDYRGFAEVTATGARVWRKHAESKTFCWIVKALNHPERYLNQVDFRFEGRCRVCDRKLTNPASLASGIGPTCEGRE